MTISTDSGQTAVLTDLQYATIIVLIVNDQHRTDKELALPNDTIRIDKTLLLDRKELLRSLLHTLGTHI